MNLDPLNIVLQFGSFGVLCLLVLHVFRHTIPRLASAFEANLRESRTIFIEQLTAQRQDFRDEMRIERAATEHQVEELTKVIKELNDLVRKQVAA